MAIGLVSDSEFAIELNKSNWSNATKTEPHARDIIPPPDSNQVEVIPPKSRGRKESDVNVPDSLRKLIGEESVINGREDAVKMASHFGISPSSVSAYANGATSTKSYHESRKSILDHINKSKERIATKAKNRLVMALNQITEEKLAGAKLKDVSSIAKDMSGIVRDMSPDTGRDDSGNKPQFIFYSPQIRKEEHFETILIKE